MGIVYFSKVTANARTSGALFVYRVHFASSVSSVIGFSGRDSDSSNASGEETSSADMSFCFFFNVVVESPSPEAPRFFVTLFAAARTCLATFSSFKTVDRVCGFEVDIAATLRL